MPTPRPPFGLNGWREPPTEIEKLFRASVPAHFFGTLDLKFPLLLSGQVDDQRSVGGRQVGAGPAAHPYHLEYRIMGIEAKLILPTPLNKSRPCKSPPADEEKMGEGST